MYSSTLTVLIPGPTSSIATATACRLQPMACRLHQCFPGPKSRGRRRLNGPHASRVRSPLNPEGLPAQQAAAVAAAHHPAPVGAPLPPGRSSAGAAPLTPLLLTRWCAGSTSSWPRPGAACASHPASEGSAGQGRQGKQGWGRQGKQGLGQGRAGRV